MFIVNIAELVEKSLADKMDIEDIIKILINNVAYLIKIYKKEFDSEAYVRMLFQLINDALKELEN